MLLSKERAKELMRRDFIPRGGPVDIKDLVFRRTGDEEVFRCCQQTAYDPQSGPIFCGDIAEFVSINEKGYVGLCGKRKHVPPNIPA